MNYKVKFLLVYTLILVIANILFTEDTRKYINIIGLIGYIVIGGIYFVLFFRKS